MIRKDTGLTQASIRLLPDQANTCLLYTSRFGQKCLKVFSEVEESISKMITNANIENVYRIIRNRNKLRFTQK